MTSSVQLIRFLKTSMNLNKLGLLISKQVGTAQAFAPWAVAFQKQYPDWKLKIYSADMGASIFKNYGLQVQPLENLEFSTHIDFVLSGTSLDADDENIWSWCRTHHTPSFAFVDQAVNLKERFQTPTKPSHILVPSEDCIFKLDAKFEVVGSPVFDELSKIMRKPVPKLALFASEPSLLEGNIDEKSFAIAQKIIPSDWTLKIQVHPRDSKKRWEKYQVSDYTREEALQSASFMLGMTSMMLQESAFLGIPTLGINPKNPPDLTDLFEKTLHAPAKSQLRSSSIDKITELIFKTLES